MTNIDYITEQDVINDRNLCDKRAAHTRDFSHELACNNK